MRVIFLVFIIQFSILLTPGYLFLACCYTLASMTATNPRNNWIDVCAYSDPTGSTCCPPGMENKEYLVLKEEHDWFGHSQACRSEYFRGQHSHWS